MFIVYIWTSKLIVRSNLRSYNFIFKMPNFLIIQQQFSPGIHRFLLLFLSEIHFFNQRIHQSKGRNIVENDSFQRHRKSNRFYCMLWFISYLLHNLFQVKYSKERVKKTRLRISHILCTGCCALYPIHFELENSIFFNLISIVLKWIE